ncbi:hypothetical protein M408DRAFT_327681 [Serendipita vermifera MAFF 305830]|uniref:SH3 domain-containing protein n=1 Tax=Serendipita vermifera MAFF 305830 TaxID=933852 RepID=A0A0C2WZK7_SERVB|nr:hypothetical protein M408DRAFT_327681 [Serendipita vermifera MAFF 305830]
MQHVNVQARIPPYGSAEYIYGSNLSLNTNGYNQSNENLRRHTGDDAGRPLPMRQQSRGLAPPHSESMMAQPSNTRPPSAYSDNSALPYLQNEPPPPLPTATSNRPQSSHFPRFVPPPSMPQPSSAPTTPGSLYPPAVDYHIQALAVVGAHPSTTPKREEPQPVFYPAMMRPQNSAQGRSSMPVEAVMARYGQALPDEGPRPAPVNYDQAPLTNSPRAMPARYDQPPPNEFPPAMPRYDQPVPNDIPPVAPIFPRSESNPAPRRPGSGHKKLSRQHTRRTQSDIPQARPQEDMQPAFLPPPQQRQSPVVEEKKRPTSLLRKLTKKRPESMPPIKGKAEAKAAPQVPQMEPMPRMEILPDVLFHVRATQDYEMQTYEELSFSLGSIIAVTAAPESGRWSGYVVDSTGRRDEGIFYRTFVSLLQRVDSSRARGNILFLAEAVYSYRAGREDEFDFSAGDTIAVYATPQGPFWFGVNERSLASPRPKLFPWKLVAPK